MKGGNTSQTITQALKDIVSHRTAVHRDAVSLEIVIILTGSEETVRLIQVNLFPTVFSEETQRCAVQEVSENTNALRG